MRSGTCRQLASLAPLVAGLSTHAATPPPGIGSIGDAHYNNTSAQCVSGAILTNTTWHATNSPLQICGDITVSQGATLTIEPGTLLHFESGVNFTVANGGALIAEGQENNRIRFTRSPTGGARWGGITIHGEPGSPETRITYSDIELNDTTAIHSVGGTVFLDHLTFGSSDRPYISLDTKTARPLSSRSLETSSSIATMP